MSTEPEEVKSEQLEPGLYLSDKLVSQRVFEHKGVEVDERIYEWSKIQQVGDVPVKHYKLLWCKNPMEEVIVNGVKNPLTHTNFPLDQLGKKGEKDARTLVRETFEKYWKL